MVLCLLFSFKNKAQNDSLTLAYKLERCHQPIKAQEILEFLEEKHFYFNSKCGHGGTLCLGLIIGTKNGSINLFDILVRL